LIEEIQVGAKDLLSTIKRIVHEGNVRRVIVRNPAGRTLLDIPLTAGIVGTVLLPVWAAIGTLAAVAAQYTVVIERTDDPPAGPPAPTQSA
jgi:hypothetical protein